MSTLPDPVRATISAVLQSHGLSWSDLHLDPQPRRLLSIEETANRLSCSRATVWRMIARGDLPKRLLGARSARVPQSAVDAIIDGRAGA